MRLSFIILLSLSAFGLTLQSALAKTEREYYMEAGEKYQAGNYKEAIELYTKAIDLKPDLAVAYNNRASSEVQLRRYEAALKDYDKAIELAPDFTRAYFGRGLTKILMFNEEEGCADLFKARGLGHPDSKSPIKKFCKEPESETK